MSVALKKHQLGFLQVDPLPTPSELEEYYSNKYFQELENSGYQFNYSKEELSYIHAKISQKSFIVEKKTSIKIGNLLDVGCGEGFVMSFYKNNNWTVHGIDFSEYGISKFNPDLLSSFEKGDIYSLLETKIENNNKFDIIWVGNVLEHVINPVDLLSRLKLLLSQDGILVVTVPNDGSAYQEMLISNDYINKKWWISYPDHLSYFTYESLINISNYAGFNCFNLISDFPIDFYLLHSGSNYVNQPNLGKEAHKARVAIENFISKNPAEIVNSFYNNLAKLGLGRDLTIFLTLNK